MKRALIYASIVLAMLVVGARFSTARGHGAPYQSKNDPGRESLARQTAGEALHGHDGQAPFDSAQGKAALQKRTADAALKNPVREFAESETALHENLNLSAQQQFQATPMRQVGQREQGATTRLDARQNAGETLQNDGGQAPFDSAQDKPARQTRARSAALKTAALHLSPNLPAQQQSQATLGPNGDPMPPRKVAITFDDLPAFSANALNGTQIVEQNDRLLATLRREKIPAIGFVNEAKLYKWGEVDERIKALQLWLDDGFDLGNHTYSHVSLNKVGLKAWEENVIEGEPVLKLLLAQHHMTLRYYRPPYLDTGADLLTRREAEQFLASRGYRVAPITIDVGDWEFAPVYFDAKRKGDVAEENRVVAAFLAYANESLDYAEQFSKQIVGYEPKQVILLHDSQLEADHFAELAAVMRKRNYSFITLDDALDDSAYSLPNNYAGGGTSWLDQWAITEGKMPPNEPQLPAWIAQRLASLH